MHNIHVVAIIFISNIVILSVHAAPTDDIKTSVYDKLIELSNTKCPYLKTTRLLEPKPSFLNTCSDFNTIKSIASLDLGTAYDIPCLFYYNNFVLLCNISQKYNISIYANNTSIDSAVQSYNVVDACVDLQSTPLLPEFKNATKILSSDFRKRNVCERICSDLITNTLTPICGLAAYSGNITMTLQKYLDKVAAKLKAEQLSKQQPDKTVKEEAPPSAKEHASSVPVQNPPKTSEQSSLNEDHSKKETQPEPKTPLKPLQTQPNSVSDHKDVSSDRPGETKSGVPQMADPPKQDPKIDVDNTNLNDQEPSENSNKPAVSGAQAVIPSTTHQEKPVVSLPSSGSENAQDSKVTDQKKNKPLSEETSSTKTTNSSPIPVQKPKPAEEIDSEEQEEQQMDPNEQENMEDEDVIPLENKVKQTEINTKPQKTEEDVLVPAYNNPTTDEEDSFFFIYFMMVCAVFILGYIGYHNKQKVLALVIEGRRSRRGSRRGRPNSANYHKLDSNLEEAVTSACNKNTANIIY